MQSVHYSDLRKICVLLFSALAIALLFIGLLRAQTGHTVTLNWTESTSSVTFDVFRETSAGACTPASLGTGPGCLKLNSVPITALTFTDSTPPIGTSFYVVRATDAKGNNGAYSNEVTVSLLAPPSAPIVAQPIVN
jgi:hypothetical protein